MKYILRMRFCKHVIGYSRRLSTVTNSSTNSKNSWDLYSSVFLERYPVITKELTDLEKRFSAFLGQLDVEKSLKSDHDLRLEEDRLRSVQFKRGELDDSEMDKIATVQTAQDFEDASQEELQKFKISSRKTAADASNDQASLSRALDRYLFLIVKQRLGTSEPWIFPQGQWKESESMRQTAERTLKTLCGDDIQVQFLGNAPVAFYKYKYPPAVQLERHSMGAKLFFFRARYLSGTVKNESEVSAFKWLTPEEMQKLLIPNYYKVISNIIINS